MSTKNDFLGKRIIVLTAHPDDEGLAAGTMYENHKVGGETFLICATYGEKGKSHLAKPMSDAALKKVRKEELLRAAKILKIDEVAFLGLPDAEVKKNAKKLFEKSLKVVSALRPDYILSFGPDGISAHWDHIIVGKIARRIAKKLKVPLVAFTLSDEMIAFRRNESFLSRRKFGKYAGIPAHRHGDIKIKIDGVRKRRAMQCHVSQFGTKPLYSHFPKRLAKTALAYEYFVSEKI